MAKKITAEQAFADVYNYMETGESADWFGTTLTPNEKKHGRVVKRYFAPYHDVTVYEDGYEGWFYIGE